MKISHFKTVRSKSCILQGGWILITAICLTLVLLPGRTEAAREKVVFWYGATQDERAAYERLISEFNRLNPDTEVRGMLVPQSYIERKLLLSVAGGVPPDVVRFYTHLGGEMMSRGGLEPLDDLITREGFDMSDFYSIGIEQNTYAGRLYGVPWVLSPYALFYNKKLFQEAGLDPNRPPRTWDELQEYALKLTTRDKDGSIERAGFTDFLNNPTNFHLFLWQSGGAPLSEDMKQVRFAGREGIEALTWMQDFLISEAGPSKPGLSRAEASAQAVRSLQTFKSTYVGATRDPFGLEKIAMRIDSPFRIPDLKKYFPDLDYGIAAAPYNRVQAIEVVGNSLVIPRGSKHKEAAWKFIKFATSREQMLMVCNLDNKFAGRIPARRSAARSPQMYGDPFVRPFVDQIEKGLGRTTPIAPGYREASAELARSIERVLTGGLTPEAGLKEAAVKGQEILDAANEDLSRYAAVPWGTAAVVSGIVLTAAIGAAWWYIARRTRGSRGMRREAVHFYLFLTPWLIGFFVLTFGSIVASLIFSMTRYDVLSPARFVGLANFGKLVLQDPIFKKALWNTLYYAFFSIPLAMIGGLAISVLMHQKLRGIGGFRTIYYLPAVVSGVATAFLWQEIFHPKSGILNKFLSIIMDNPPQWLLDPVWSKPAFIIMGLWGIGGTMIIYLAGLQSIPEELYEASKIDGANAWQRFRNVTLPLLTPTILYQLIIGTMAAFQFFTPVYIMTRGDGGPADSTMFYSLYLFKNSFEFMKMGYASAMAWILLSIVLVVTLIQLKSASRWVYYEGTKEG